MLDKEYEAFKAGYHCQWDKEQKKYYFDPEMSPGDPDGAYMAWLNTLLKIQYHNTEDCPEGFRGCQQCK